MFNKYLIITFFSILLFSCTKDQSKILENSVNLEKVTVSHTNTGQFLQIESSVDWNIELILPDKQSGTWCSINPNKGHGSMSNISFSYSLNDSDTPRSVEIKVNFAGEIKTIKFTQLEVSSAGDGGGSTVTDLVSDVFRPWMELPALDNNTENAFIVHYVAENNNNSRNYSICYDPINKLARWVAYPLSNNYIGSLGRTDMWSYDPKIPAKLQPNLFRSFGVYGYDRGHQIPSADRTAEYSMNVATFYYSNMTAQNSRLNQGVWAELESKLRGWRSTCDTLYVITGPVLSLDGDSKINYIKDNDGNDVAIPKAYFKVILKYNKKANGEIVGQNGDGFSCIAFWFKNTTPLNGSLNISSTQSVREIEKRTGIDFFANLSKELQDKIETEYKPANWL